ncbi:hypothetical protein NT6N_16490 [Oceaniferula spumae]|uniref:DUF4450 domain-containing protein n=1 Tax=Oceaniferula spumae TaxID=2979115 RepID=A0AAT9FKR1_9BACT
MTLNGIQKIFTAALLFLLVTVVQGQDAGEEKDGRKDKARTAYIIYTGGGMFFNEPIIIRSGNKNTKLQLSKRTASQPVKIHTDGIIDFVKENPDHEKNPFISYAKAIIPKETRKALIVLSPLKVAKNGQLCSTRVISLSKFENGNWLFINLTPRNVAVNVGEKKLGLKPGESSIYRAASLTKSTNKTVSYAYYHPEMKKWKLLSSSTCVIRPTRREICVFSWNPKTNRMDYHGITFTEAPE